jgi:hypothetical protein
MPLIPATWEVDIRKITVLDQPGQKSYHDPIPTNKLGMVVSACHPSYSGDTGKRSKAGLRQKHKTLSEK